MQDFISSARRTRDLWFGSEALSKISRAAAIAVHSVGGKLIFPAGIDVEDVANVILAELPDGSPEEVSRAAKSAALERWRKFADAAKTDAAKLELIRTDIWDEQVDDVVEFYAAWTPLKSESQYKEARQRVMRLLAGRKMCRDFKPAKGHPGVPKSSLDGARESVWKKSFTTADLNTKLERRLRLSMGEQLDVVGLTKRLAVKRGYRSVSRIAADPWLRGLPEDRVRSLAVECAKLADKGLIQIPSLPRFPFEGTAVYRNRLKELAEETGEPREVYDDLRKALAKLKADCYGEPEPYLAILVADGDRMGKTISKIKTAEAHREFSRKLASFAVDAREIVEKTHHGSLVYSGGDDVLAFLPVDTCIECTRQLHNEFGQAPTLSAGIAIGHFMEPLEDLLQYARGAEHAAKQLPERNALAIHLHSRGGAPVKLCRQWSDDFPGRLLELAKLHAANLIPDKAAYDLRELARDYEHWPADMLAAALPDDVRRLMKRKRSRRGDEGLDSLKKMLEPLRTAQEVRTFADEMIVARRIAAAQLQAKERT